MKIEAEFEETNWHSVFDKAVIRGLTKATIIVANNAKKLCPVRTGRLANSIKREVKGDTGIVFTNVEYAPVIEFGNRKSYIIKAKGKGYLHFKIGGRWVRVKKVRHPKMKAQPYMRPALYNNKDKINSVINTEIRNAKAQ